jgi:SAM-dependent methyltransferase
MSTRRHSEDTIAYYERNARAFVRGSLNVRMEPLYGPFLGLLPQGGHILDAGCGSGRDAREFKRRGYRVTAIDASPTLARLAAEIIGQTVEVVPFEELPYEDAFDGIWACASLLHVARTDMDDVLTRLARALRLGGVCYASFKWGESERHDDGRLFKDYTEESFATLLHQHPCLEVLRAWRTEDLRPGKSGQRWLNVLLRKGRAGQRASS